MSLQSDPHFDATLARRHRWSSGFATLCSLCTWAAICVLLVLLLSVASNVNRNGTLSVFVYGKEITDEQYAEIEAILKSQDHVTDVERDVSPSGDVSFHLTIEDLRTNSIRATRSKEVIKDLESELGSLSISDGVIVAFSDNDDGQVLATISGGPTETELEQISGTLRANVNVWSMTNTGGKAGEANFTLDTNVRYRDIEASIVEDLKPFKESVQEANPNLNIETDSTEPVVGWDWGFLWRSNSTQKPENAGVRTGIWGSLWLVLVTALIAVPLGVGAAVYLEEYSSDTWVTRIIKLNLANLAGVPSIVYGILGFAVFGRFMALGSTILAGALTLALLILPIIIVATQEALKAIPGSIRTASIALGATKWQTVRHQVLPASLPGIATGVILALSRALGETAPIVVIGVLALTDSSPGNIESPVDLLTKPQNIASVPFDDFQALPVLIYEWVKDFRPEFAAQAARGILVLLVVLLLINSTAILIRNRYQKNLKW